MTYNISVMMRDRGLVTMDHLKETIYCESNGHVTDDVTCLQNSQELQKC